MLFAFVPLTLIAPVRDERTIREFVRLLASQAMLATSAALFGGLAAAAFHQASRLIGC